LNIQVLLPLPESELISYCPLSEVI